MDNQVNLHCFIPVRNAYQIWYSRLYRVKNNWIYTSKIYKISGIQVVRQLLNKNIYVFHGAYATVYGELWSQHNRSKVSASGEQSGSVTGGMRKSLFWTSIPCSSTALHRWRPPSTLKFSWVLQTPPPSSKLAAGAHQMSPFMPPTSAWLQTWHRLFMNP